MAPGNLVISAYVTCPDITKTVTPDLKLPGSGKLIHVDLAQGQNRHLGGSCLGQVCCAHLECFDSVLCSITFMNPENSGLKIASFKLE